MITQKKTLKKWFSNFMKPAQEHFAAWIDSYWHKNEQIPMSNIDGLSLAIEGTASAKQLLNHLDDTNAHRNLFDKKVDKEEGKGLSSNDFTNEHKQKLEGLQPTDVSGLLPKGGYDGTGQQLKDAIDGLQTKMGQVETTLSVDDTAFDTLQEIATQVKSNKNLETLLTGKVDKDSVAELLKKIFATDTNLILSAKLINLTSANSRNFMALGDETDMIIMSDENFQIRAKKNIGIAAEHTLGFYGKKISFAAESYEFLGAAGVPFVTHDIFSQEVKKLESRIKDLEAKG